MRLSGTSEYGRMSAEEVITLLETSTGGLIESEAKKRLKLFGRNEVAEKKENPVREFLGRYWGPMPWLLELAMALSFFLGHYLEVAIIFGLLTANATIGFLHTRGSRRALELLKRKLAVKAKVMRNGECAVRDAGELVPGDFVPAKPKIVSDGEVSVDQSALTGESLPVSVRESGIVYSSSIVRQGEARCVVVNTDVNTYFGRTTELSSPSS